MTLVFIAAETREFEGLRKHLRRTQNLHWTAQFAETGELNGRPVVLVANGPGPKLAAAAAGEAVNRLNKIDAFISTGYCGALDQTLTPFSIVVASDVNGKTALRPVTASSFTAGPVLSQDRVACTVDEKSKLRKTGAIAVEMEAAAVEQVARKSSVPFYCVRAVTDAAAEALPLDFNDLRDRDGRFSRARIIAAACRRPARLVAKLLKLDRTCKSASMALGDFIADCRF